MKLAEADLLRLLPEHISGDPQFSAAAAAANPVLASISKAIPNLLLWARLGGQKPATFLPPLKRLTEARPGLAKLNTATLESLAWQFHVDFREVARTDARLAELILNSIAWHRIKGTPKSMYDALILCGFDTRYSEGEAKKPYGIYIEEGGPQVHWATYQLGFEEIADYDDLKAIVRICREMQPARCRLWRVYTFDFDIRPGCWSGPLPQNAWSNAWWSVWSGVFMPEIPGLDERGLLVSWGKRLRILCEGFSEHKLVIASQQKTRFARAYVRHIPRWSEVCWSRFRFCEPIGSAIWQRRMAPVWEYEKYGEPWGDGKWPAQPWSEGFRIIRGELPNGWYFEFPILLRPEFDWRPQLGILCERAWVIADPSLQSDWQGAGWPNQPWIVPVITSGPYYAFGGQLLEYLITDAAGKPWPENAWPDASWPEQAWPADSWYEYYRDQDSVWGNWPENLHEPVMICEWQGAGALALPPDFGDPWPDAAWPDRSWSDRLKNLLAEPCACAALDLAATVSDPDLQPVWPDAPWPEQGWRNLASVGRPALFQGGELALAQIGAEQNLADATAAALSASFAAIPLPEDFYEIRPDEAWPGQSWDNALRQTCVEPAQMSVQNLQPATAPRLAPESLFQAESLLAQGGEPTDARGAITTWQNLGCLNASPDLAGNWQAASHYGCLNASPDLAGNWHASDLRASRCDLTGVARSDLAFATSIDISPDARWPEIPWPDCAWQPKELA